MSIKIMSFKIMLFLISVVSFSYSIQLNSMKRDIEADQDNINNIDISQKKHKKIQLKPIRKIDTLLNLPRELNQIILDYMHNLYLPSLIDTLYCNDLYSLENNKLATVDFDKILIWDLATKKNVDTLNIGSISCLYSLKSQQLAVGFHSGNIRILDLNIRKYIKEIECAHQSEVTCLCLYQNDKLISGSKDHTIKIWDLNTAKCLNTLTDHKMRITCLCLYQDDKLISGSKDHTIKIWDLNTGKCLNTLANNQEGIRSMCLLGNNKLVSGEEYATIKIWDLNTKECIYELEEAHSSCVTCLCFLDNNIFASGSHDSTIKIWDSMTGKCLNTFKPDIRGVKFLDLINNRLVLGDYIHKITIFDPNLEYHYLNQDIDNDSNLHI